MKYISSVYNKNKNKERYKDIKITLFSISSSILAIIIIIYIIYIKNLLIEDAYMYIKTTANKEVNEISNSILTTKETLKSIANIDIINKSDILNNEKIKLLEEETKTRGFKRIGIANLNGDVFTTDGIEFSIKDRWYFNEIISGKEFAYEKNIDKIDGKDIFISAVPITEYGNIEGVLFSTDEIDRIINLTSSEYYNGKIEKYIIEYDGNIVSKNNYLNFNNSNNLFELLSKENKYNEAEKIIDKIRNKESGVEEITYNKSKYYMGYTPIPNSKDLYVVISIPKSLVLVNIKKILLASCILISIIICIFYFTFRHMVKFKEVYKHLEDSNEAKRIFLSNISHEIRTPINAIIGMVILCEKYASDDERSREYLEKIKVSSNHLLYLVNDILDISKIEAGKVKINEDIIKVDIFIESINTIIKDMSTEKNQSYIVDINNIEGLYIIGDELKLRQVLLNLLSNAVKFTNRNGKILFEITAININNPKKIKMEFKVIDNGIGMTEEFMKRMFIPFNQADNSYSRKFGGTGLGLPISKELIERMGSSLIVKSQLEVGSEFKFCMDFNKYRIESNSELELIKENKLEIYYNKNILLVEDNEINRIIANELLKELGVNVDCVENGQEAVEKFNESEIKYYDLIFMDIQMPIMDGYEATKQIRLGNREDSKEIKIIAMTAHAFNEDKEECIMVGMNYHIAKPINREVINDVFKKYFKE